MQYVPKKGEEYFTLADWYGAGEERAEPCMWNGDMIDFRRLRKGTVFQTLRDANLGVLNLPPAPVATIDELVDAMAEHIDNGEEILISAYITAGDVLEDYLGGEDDETD